MSILETTSFPDVPGIIKQMDIRLKLADVSEDSLLGLSIKVALMKNKPNKVIFETILDAYKHNPAGTIEVVSKPVMDAIRKLHHC